MKFLRQFMNDQKVEKKYVLAGAQFGDAVSYIYMGECIGFESMLNRWSDWEKEYINRGYRTVALDDFIELGGYGKNIDHLLRQKRDENEVPIYHAQIYRDIYLGKISPIVDLNVILNGNGDVQIGICVIPSTKNTSE